MDLPDICLGKLFTSCKPARHLKESCFKAANIIFTVTELKLNHVIINDYMGQ